jgi:POT family proton-dependent oligopeptide transporter
MYKNNLFRLLITVSQAWSMSVFFLIFTAIPVAAGLVLMAMTPVMKRWMHGVH